MTTPTELVPAVVVARAEAKKAGLRYVSDEQPGFRRTGGARVRYLSARGRAVRNPALITRLQRLAIPPAWTAVWICPDPHGHIQATGRDARGRKQYRYHPDWRGHRDGTKFERMLAFGRALPAIRQRVMRDLRADGFGRAKVIAAMVRLLETTHIRVGNEEYARENHSFGLSTLRDRHVKIRGEVLRFKFLGKSGKTHEIELHDARLARIVRRSQHLPGQELFQYLDETGARQKVSSEDVNAYLREIAGDEFSAKDFRTWAGTVLAAAMLGETLAVAGARRTKKSLGAAIERVAQHLGNTATVCRKSYIHPAILSGYLAGEEIPGHGSKPSDPTRRASRRLEGIEHAVLAFLKKKGNQPKLTLTDQLRKSLRKS